LKEVGSAFLLVLLYHLPELFFAPSIDPAKKEAFALALTETCYFASVVCEFVKIAISEHVKTAAVFDSARTVVASDPVTPAVAFYSAMTVVASAAPIVVASDHGKKAVVSDQLTASSDFARILACRSHASRLHYPSSVLDHSNPLKDAY
jgi:hypothetical protein